MAETLEGKRVALLVTDGFEQIEMTDPRQALKDAGAEVHLVAPGDDVVQGWNHHEKGDNFAADVLLKHANPDDYDLLVLPGGVLNADHLRLDGDAVRFAQAFFRAGKPVAAICHGAWLLAEADVVRGRRMTSYPSLKTDLRNAGAEWVDEEVVVDAGLVTSRKPSDLPAFDRETIRALAEGRSAAQAA
jgi:protease I